MGGSVFIIAVCNVRCRARIQYRRPFCREEAEDSEA